MRKALVPLLALVAAALPAQQPAPANEAAFVKQTVDRFLQPFLQQTGAPGAIVGVSLHGRRYFFPYGQATDDGSPFTPATLVEIGSCTKVFTTTLFALAVARQQINPNGSAQQYMPPGFTLQPLAQQVTPLELADFTSGMPDSATDLPVGPIRRNIEHYTVKDFLSWASGWQPASPPPAPYLYSNAGIGLLSYLVATATHQPWQQQMDNEILGPLGLLDTELRPSPNQMSRLAMGHRRNGQPATPWPIFAWYAAGGLRSTATDMLRFGEANLGHTQVDGRPVSPDLIAAMKSAQKPIYTLPGTANLQGMAWAIITANNSPQLRPEILKNGGTDGFNTVILLNPSKDLTIFIAVNQSGTNPAAVAVALGRHLP